MSDIIFECNYYCYQKRKHRTTSISGDLNSIQMSDNIIIVQIISYLAIDCVRLETWGNKYLQIKVKTSMYKAIDFEI